MKVLVASPLPGDALHQLAQHHDVVMLSEATHDGALAAARAHPDASAFLSLLTVRVDGALLAEMPSLQVVSNFAVGVDNIDLDAARARNVCVCNTPDVLTDATADLAFSLMLACARRVVEADGFLRAGRWRSFSPSLLLGRDVARATLGIVGFGRIGRALAARASGFSMRVLYTATREHAHPFATRVSLQELLSESDYVSLHCPLTPETRGMIDAAALARMKPTAVLINTARGAIVDEDALADALHRSALGGAGIDVFRDEPRVSERLLSAPNTVLTPHIGSASLQSRAAMAARAVEGILDVLAGRAPRFRVA